MYFLVSFKNENEIICSNIVIADSKEEAEAAYSEHEWVRAKPATDAVLQWATNSGVPIMSAKEKRFVTLPMHTPKIKKFLELSMSHIKESTALRLGKDPDDNNLGLTVYPFPYGYWVYVGHFGILGGRLSCGDRVFENIPSDLEECMKLAVKNDCQWIQFDSEGEVAESLSTYDW